jgi:hypothetical protein
MTNDTATCDRDESVVDGRRVSTDGGTDRVDDASERQSHFQSLFLDVTGVEECVDRQDTMSDSRYVDADTTSVSVAVADVVSWDGLTDTIDESEPNNEMD